MHVSANLSCHMISQYKDVLFLHFFSISSYAAKDTYSNQRIRIFLLYKLLNSIKRDTFIELSFLQRVVQTQLVVQELQNDRRLVRPNISITR